jgi:alkylation response protein AidB-like acyl-CoA dehydrogenase
VDFSFSDEQNALRASVRRVMDDRYPIERVAAIADGEGFDRSEWTLAARAGWIDVSVPESDGGAGLGFVEEAIVSEELGRALYPGPFLASVVMALPALQAAGAEWGGVAAGDRIATVAFVDPGAVSAATDGGATTLDGDVPMVLSLDIADHVILFGGGLGSTWIVDATLPGAERRPLLPVDGTRSIGSLRLHHAPAHALAIDADVRAHVRDRALAALAAEACGLAGHVLELSAQYARERQQFGRPIGSFQAVSHELARSYMDIETSRSLAYWAAGLVQDRDREAPAAAAAAKARAAEAAVLACERAIQAHGGVGFTWEHPLHRYYKRALGIAATIETADALWGRVADHATAPAVAEPAAEPASEPAVGSPA